MLERATGIASPLHPPFVDDAARTLASTTLGADGLAFEVAGPRALIAFEPTTTRAAILTAGGLCPGMNNVVRGLVLELVHAYGVHAIDGVRFGFEGFVPGAPEPLALDRAIVRDIHRLGGTLLGTSRLRVPTDVVADSLVRRGTDLVFTIGGDGTLRAARELDAELRRRRARTVVIAVPKTIDGDVGHVDTFGFTTAVEYARAAIDAAHAEARSARNGVGVVKLMGRDAGFIAAHATLASAEANFCLVPEFPIAIDDLTASLERRIRLRGHAVVVVAEGCGKSLATTTSEHDAAGNLRYASADLDIGPVLCAAIRHRFAVAGTAVVVKYIDPSYTIRAAPANASDAIYCARLARHAVHAAMAGKTGIVVGSCRGTYAHVPIGMAIADVRRVDAELWQTVCDVTGQLQY